MILDDRRLMDLKRLAAERATALSAVVDEFLADGIRRARLAGKRVTALPAFDMGQPRVDVAGCDQLWQAWSGIEVPDRYRYSAAGCEHCAPLHGAVSRLLNEHLSHRTTWCIKVRQAIFCRVPLPGALELRMHKPLRVP